MDTGSNGAYKEEVTQPRLKTAAVSTVPTQKIEADRKTSYFKLKCKLVSVLHVSSVKGPHQPRMHPLNL